MRLDWIVNTPVDSSLTSLMSIAADEAEKSEAIKIPCSISVRLCNDEEIRVYNRDFRHIDKATDVLSFPSVAYPKGKTAGSQEKLLRREYDDDSGTCFLGDLIISVPHIYNQAREFCHSPAREAAYLLVHGICHLMGYDHINEEEKKVMRKMEEKILDSVGLSQDDPACNPDKLLLKLAREAMKKSYSPYSHYPVGAALHSTDGRIFLGCNVENASYGLSNCAERTAVFKAISDGATEFDIIAIASKGSFPWPCGACRQVLNEFSPHIRILVTSEGQDNILESTLDQLLPHGFGPKDLPEQNLERK